MNQAERVKIIARRLAIENRLQQSDYSFDITPYVKLIAHIVLSQADNYADTEAPEREVQEHVSEGSYGYADAAAVETTVKKRGRPKK